ncbi:aldo/keto reductase [Natronomonas sp. EA1]|uniref:aldo/keto reductase n=1 Tax=Natronomonas sp. EA1 TaxID=3421655 RepID=UPI003EBA6FCA
MELPPVGLGTMGIDDPAVVARAIDLGYRHLDTAQIYENEAVVGEGIAMADTPREELTVATKVWASNLAPEDVRVSTEASLERLGLDHVDLLYVHRPIEAYDPATTLPAFDALREDGLVREVGVSNFEPDDLEHAREHLESPIAANQVEYHPLFRPTRALADARANDYELVGYSPLAGGRVFDLPVVSEIADAHDASPAQVAIAWLLEQGIRVIPKASSEAHLRANLAAAELSLSPEEVARIDAIEEREELFPE